MPRELSSWTGVKRGDVLQCARVLADKKTGKPYTWRFFGIVVQPGVQSAKIHIVGKHEPGDAVIMKFRPEATFLHLEPHEWPPGIHAYRMRLILENVLDIH